MIEIIVIGDERFYKDSAKTLAEMPHFMMESLDHIRGFIHETAVTYAPIDKTGTEGRAPGELKRRGIVSHRAFPRGFRTYEAEVGLSRAVKHALFVHQGTALGGMGLIHSMKGNVLAFKKEGRSVVRRWVHGQEPQPFLTTALADAKFTEIPLQVKLLGHKIVH